jgi:anti-sigma28 factor (negative regulator of flagellin synthesis)
MRRIRVWTPSSGRRAVTNYVHMTVLAVRYQTGKARRFGRDEESRRMHMQQLRERIELDAYAVDPHKVADAIMRRLLAEARRP